MNPYTGLYGPLPVRSHPPYGQDRGKNKCPAQPVTAEGGTCFVAVVLHPQFQIY